MAETDNLILNPGTGGSTLATDAIGSVHHQRGKVQHSADGSAADASAATPLPVEEQVQSPQHEQLTSAGLTAGGNVDLTTTDIARWDDRQADRGGLWSQRAAQGRHPDGVGSQDHPRHRIYPGGADGAMAPTP